MKNYLSKRFFVTKADGTKKLNLVFISGIAVAFFAIVGIDPETVSTWQSALDLIIAWVNNPYKLIMSIWAIINIFNNPTTSGLKN